MTIVVIINELELVECTNTTTLQTKLVKIRNAIDIDVNLTLKVTGYLFTFILPYTLYR